MVGCLLDSFDINGLQQIVDRTTDDKQSGQAKIRQVIEYIHLTASNEISKAEKAYQTRRQQLEDQVTSLEQRAANAESKLVQVKGEYTQAKTQYHNEIRRLEDLLTRQEQKIFNAGYHQGSRETDATKLRQASDAEMA